MTDLMLAMPPTSWYVWRGDGSYGDGRILLGRRATSVSAWITQELARRIRSNLPYDWVILLVRGLYNGLDGIHIFYGPDGSYEGVWA